MRQGSVMREQMGLQQLQTEKLGAEAATLTRVDSRYRTVSYVSYLSAQVRRVP